MFDYRISYAETAKRIKLQVFGTSQGFPQSGIYCAQVLPVFVFNFFLFAICYVYFFYHIPTIFVVLLL